MHSYPLQQPLPIGVYFICMYGTGHHSRCNVALEKQFIRSRDEPSKSDLLPAIKETSILAGRGPEIENVEASGYFVQFRSGADRPGAVEATGVSPTAHPEATFAIVARCRRETAALWELTSPTGCPRGAIPLIRSKQFSIMPIWQGLSKCTDTWLTVWPTLTPQYYQITANWSFTDDRS
jgi:hypothetical protein